MTSGGPGQPTSLPMGSWPKLIKVTMPYDDTCASRRITADLLRWSIDAEPRYGYDFVDYVPPSAPAASAPVSGVTRVVKHLRQAAKGSVRRWSHWMYLRCRALSFRSCIPPDRSSRDRGN